MIEVVRIRSQVPIAHSIVCLSAPGCAVDPPLSVVLAGADSAAQEARWPAFECAADGKGEGDGELHPLPWAMPCNEALVLAALLAASAFPAWTSHAVSQLTMW